MTAHLEVFKPAGPELVLLDGQQVWIGRADANDVVLAYDKSVGRQHAVMEPVAGGWSVRDLGSRNGTFVAGERVTVRVLRSGDELTVGRTKLVFRTAEPRDLNQTHGGERPPELTRRERDVLRALCRPLASAQMFTEPATLREIATELVVSEPAVEQHLLRLYTKFGIAAGGRSRRSLLANEALRRNAITLAELAEQPPP